MSADFWIILTGACVAVSCALLGSFLLLRKMTMMGDAISHAVLPGIVAAFLLSGSRDPFYMILGASALGLLSVVLVEWMQKKIRLQSDAAIGMTFTFLFSVGVILMSLFAGKIDLDLDCVLYGEIALITFDTWTTAGGTELGPVTTWISGGMLLLCLAFVLLAWKELKLTTFDAAFADANGMHAQRWHYLLMSMVSLTTVSAFNAVGAILVVAFLVVPPATGYLLSRNLRGMVLIAAASGILSAAGGYYLAAWLNASISGCMSVCAGLLLGIAVLAGKK